MKFRRPDIFQDSSSDHIHKTYKEKFNILDVHMHTTYTMIISQKVVLLTFLSPSIGVKPPGKSFSTVAKPLLGSLVCLVIKYIQTEMSK